MSQRHTGVILGYINILVKNLVNLLYIPMLLAFVGQESYGLFQMVNSFVLPLTLLSFGFSGAYVRFYMQRSVHGSAEDVKKLNGIYLVVYITVTLLALIVGMIAAGSAGALFSGGISPDQIGLVKRLVVILTIAVAATLMSNVFDGYIVAHERFSFQQSRQIVVTLVTPGIAWLLLSSGVDVTGVALAQLFANLGLLGLNARYATKSLHMEFDLRRLDWGLLAAVAVFSGWIFLNQVFDLVTLNVPTVILGAMAGAAPVAVFSVAALLRTVFFSLSSAVASVFGPLINRIVAESDSAAQLGKLMARVGKYQAVLFCYCFGGFILFGQWFITAWAGADFSQAYALGMIMIAPLLVPLTQNTGIEIQRARNMHRVRSLVYLALAAAGVIVTVMLVPILGIWSPAVAYAGVIVLGPGVFMNWYYQRMGLNMVGFWRGLLPVIVSGGAVTGLCYLAGQALPVTSLVLFIGEGCAYTVVFALVVWFILVSRSRREQVISAVRGRLGR